ncbi:unnamed protein product [Acanthoscelides obtectus]|uniref:Ig-like domain-containing protein n=1 Tax=Acanthoscelides obtectus TaxID=200917 RepID=A0A9P0L2E0_ACAOB|nr:unnamed protein product [Acanthoscelides obtectus]CAK1639338.1 hypothetical protein AOBTE_LOCUS11131 [Acanthoscelides obtectus]
MTQHVFLVSVPPEKIHIYDDNRLDKSVLLGPYNEGATVNLLCVVRGGRPKPKVIWYLENTVIDDSYEVRPDGFVHNHLTFPNVGRQHLHARLICQASNTNIVPPMTKAAVLDVNRKCISSVQKISLLNMVASSCVEEVVVQRFAHILVLNNLPDITHK